MRSNTSPKSSLVRTTLPIILLGHAQKKVTGGMLNISPYTNARCANLKPLGLLSQMFVAKLNTLQRNGLQLADD